MSKPSQPDPESRRQFDMSMQIQAEKAAVWKALTDADELSRWFAADASVDAKVGGEIVWNWGDLFTWPQEIEILEPGTRLRTRYQSSIADAQNKDLKAPLFVDFFLEGEGGSTTLRLCHSGFGEDASFDSEYDGISRGWPVELRSLRLYLEQHLGKERQLVWSTATSKLPRSTVWKTLCSDEGLAGAADMQSKSEGERFAFSCGDESFQGTILRCNDYELTGIAESHGNAFLRISLEEHMQETLIWLWLSCYGQDPKQVAAIQENWDSMLRNLFVGESETVEGA